MKEEQISLDNVAAPCVELTEAAIGQFRLMKEHDQTLKGLVIRVNINGKGCDGFEYGLGMDKTAPSDIQAQVPDNFPFPIALDPFAAYYLQKFTVDYITDYEKNEEGFIIINQNQKNFEGKFWLDNQDLAPSFN
jgi:iron-sulfur cluster insertion protein